MGLSLMADGSALPSQYRGLFTVYRKAGGTGSISYGPYTCQRVPISGTDRSSLPGNLVEAEDRIFFPPNAVLGQGDAILWVERNRTFSVLYVMDAPTYLEAYVKRSGIAVPGLK